MLHDGWQETGSRSLWCVGKVKGNVGTAPLQRLLAEYPGPRLLVLLLSLFETFHVRREIRESLKRLVKWHDGFPGRSLEDEFGLGSV
jgi:hypothetical protein